MWRCAHGGEPWRAWCAGALRHGGGDKAGAYRKVQGQPAAACTVGAKRLHLDAPLPAYLRCRPPYDRAGLLNGATRPPRRLEVTEVVTAGPGTRLPTVRV